MADKSGNGQGRMLDLKTFENDVAEIGSQLRQIEKEIGTDSI